MSSKHEEKHHHSEKRTDLDEAHDTIKYAEFKLLLKPEELRKIVDAHELWSHMRHAVDQTKVGFIPTPGDPVIKQRDIMFYDTPTFDLYENHFILRRRTHFRDGWTQSHDELTFKYRHAEAAEVEKVDLRPAVSTPTIIKFKREILPLPDRVGGSRYIYTRNCVMAMPPMEKSGDIDMMMDFFPALAPLLEKCGAQAHIAMVNRVSVTETLTEFGILDFGKGYSGKVSLALWRDAGSYAPIVSELGFQLKFDNLDDKVESHLAGAEEFFRTLQHYISRWIFLGTTKTNLVYRRKGKEVHNRE
ncbi:MAG: hypothetical protein FJ144_13300 [Deltaproteobacteria bacterium]|nr:hypothetical protein [Deltaproteobacteria bacterium]